MPTLTACPLHPQAANWPHDAGNRCAVCGRFDDDRPLPSEPQIIRTFDSYQRHVCARSGAGTGRWKRDLAYFAIALPAEAGEVAEAVLLNAEVGALTLELGDLFWGVATCADHLKLTLAEVALRDARAMYAPVDATVLLHMNAYQRAVLAPVGTRIDQVALSLASHAGRFADLVKKHQYHGTALDTDGLVREVGCVLRRVASMASVMGVTLEQVAEANLAKLRKRYPPDGFFDPAVAQARAISVDVS